MSGGGETHDAAGAQDPPRLAQEPPRLAPVEVLDHVRAVDGVD
jgi:hypothetical protein